MDSFEKMMEAEGAKPAKDDFKELVDFIPKVFCHLKLLDKPFFLNLSL